MDQILFALEPNLTVDEFINCLVRSTLSERRPVGNRATIEGMLRHADLVVTGRSTSGLLIGVSRAITDYHYATYLSDLAVDKDYQRQGIGRRLIQETHERAGKQTTLILLSAPAAVNYYPHIGMQQHPSAWVIPRQS
jgi:ribosomal protein S18 acetylase RimI-like enzyme